MSYSGGQLSYAGGGSGQYWPHPIQPESQQSPFTHQGRPFAPLEAKGTFGFGSGTNTTSTNITSTYTSIDLLYNKQGVIKLNNVRISNLIINKFKFLH